MQETIALIAIGMGISLIALALIMLYRQHRNENRPPRGEGDEWKPDDYRPPYVTKERFDEDGNPIEQPSSNE